MKNLCFRPSLFSAALVLSSIFLNGCASQPPSVELSKALGGRFLVLDSSGDRVGTQQIELSLHGQSGTVAIQGDAAAAREMALTRCTVLNSGTVDALSWKSSFLGGKEADVIRCSVSGPGLAQHFAIARAESGALEYHPPMLARMQSGVKDIRSNDGWLVFLWSGVGTTAYAVNKQSASSH